MEGLSFTVYIEEIVSITDENDIFIVHLFIYMLFLSKQTSVYHTFS